MARTYKRCARLLPYLRECRFCNRKNCAIRTEKMIDFNQEHPLIEYAEDQREMAEVGGKY